MALRRLSEDPIVVIIIIIIIMIIIIIIIHRSLPVLTLSFASCYRWPPDQSATDLVEGGRAYLTVENDGCCLQIGHGRVPRSSFLSQPVRRRQIWSWGREAGERVDVTRIRACETYKIDLSLSCLAAVWTVDCHRGKYYYLPRIPAADYRFRVVSQLQLLCGKM